MRDPDFIQHGIGPYVLMKTPDGVTSPLCVGRIDLQTGRHIMPDHGFMVDDPVMGRVSYDAEGRRIVSET